MKVDIHVHLAGVGTGDSGCWTSPVFMNRPVLRLLRRLFRISETQMRTSADQDWAALIADRVRASELDAAVALGFDGVYDRSGELDRRRSQMIVPPSWVVEACRRHHDVLLPGPSVNPMRRDALERLDESIEGGAVLIKWLPAAQGIDPSDPAHGKFYERLAASGVALLVHSGGGELTFAEVEPRLKDIALLEGPLRTGVTVVCAHSGVPVHLSRDVDQMPLLRSLLERYPNLWLDNSGMANPSRFAHLARLARDAEIGARTMYGSDYPVPCIPIQYLHRLGPARAWRLQRERNPFDRDVRLKRALGYSDDTLTRAAGVLPRLREAAR